MNKAIHFQVIFSNMYVFSNKKKRDDRSLTENDNKSLTENVVYGMKHTHRVLLTCFSNC